MKYKSQPALRCSVLLHRHIHRPNQIHTPPALSQSAPSALQTSQDDTRILDGGLHLAQEHDRLTSVNQTVVVGQGDVHHGADDNLECRINR